MKIIDRHSVSPPSGSVPPTTISLSFLDVFWLYANPVKRVFLYKLPSISTQHFLQNILPTLKHSLSLALKYFFPVAGSLVFQPNSRPYIRYDEGCSVALTVAESDEDFEYLVNRDGNKKMINDASLSELVPTLSKDELLFGIQVTVFPDSGICIGIACKHVLGDGRSIMHFLRTWSSIFRNNSNDDFVPPVLDRSLVPDPGGVLHDTLLKQLASIPPSIIEYLKQPKEATGMIKVRVTFSIKRSEINKMREWILSDQVDQDGEKLHLSSFVLTCSLIWICHLKSQSAINGDDVKDDDQCSFGFTFDCCDRYEYHSIVPATYFGNCLCLGGNTLAKRIELQGENGLTVAVKAIGKTIKDLVAKGPMKDADKWFSGASTETSEIMHNMLTVAGSPRLGVYGLDFGWGKPEKVEVVSIEFPKAVSLAELRDEVGGGIEAALVMDQPQMEAFIGIFEESKAKYCLWES